MRTRTVAAMVLAFSVAAPLAAVPVASAQTPAVSMARTPSPPGAEAYIISPKHGAKVHSPVTVVFGLKGMGVAPAGIKFDKDRKSTCLNSSHSQISYAVFCLKKKIQHH